MLGIGVLLQLSWQVPPLTLGLLSGPCPHAGLGKSSCLQNTFVQHIDYGGSFLSAHILYLPGHMPKFCKSGLPLNKEPTSVTDSTAFSSQFLSTSSATDSALFFNCHKDLFFQKSMSETAPHWPAVGPPATAGLSYQPASWRSQLEAGLESTPGTAAITDTQMQHDIFA